MPFDISDQLNSSSIQLERSALERFGATVDDSRGQLGKVFRPDSQESSESNVTGNPSVWTSTPYASGLVKADQIDFNPRLKFLFKISFQFSPGMAEAASAWGYDLRKLQENVTFTVTRIDRPKWDYEYEEVNMYNYRTKVLKQIKHREVGFTLYDDVGNNVMNFINLYRKLLSPIARTEVNSYFPNPDAWGMQFERDMNGLDTALRGTLPQDAIGVFKKMTIHQIFVERGNPSRNPEAWTKMVNFEFINPRFTSIDIDDMDHENGSSYSLVNFTVDFDTVFMTDVVPFSKNRTPTLPSGDIPGIGSNEKNPAGGGTNAFASVLSRKIALDKARANNFEISAGGAGIISGGSQAYALPTVSYVQDNTLSQEDADLLSSRTSSNDEDW